MSAPATVSGLGALDKHRRITGARRREIGAELMRGYQRGATLRELAALTGRSNSFVRAVLVESGVAKATLNRRVSPAERDRIAAEVVGRYRDGATIRDLMALTGRSYTVVRAVLVESGVALRRPGRIRRDGTGMVSGAARVRAAMNQPPPC